MRRRIGAIYALFAVVVFLTLLLIFVFRLNTARTQNIAEASVSYERLTEQLQTEVRDIEQLATLAERHFEATEAVQAITLYFPDTGIFFVRSRREPVLALGQRSVSSFTGFPEYRLSEIEHLLFRQRITSRNQSPIYSDAVYAVLSESDVYAPLRDTLILLLAFAFVTVLATILLNGQSDRPRKRVRRTPEVHPQARTARDTSRSDRASSPNQTPPTPGPETHTSPPKENFEEVNVEEIETDQTEPGTLFNPSTGLSFRSHLDRKLGLELERAAYNDQDLSCILIAFDDIRSADEYVERARNILDAFQFEDLCFEFGPKSFFAILPNTELPQAIRQATEFRKRYRASAMGLSARNGRLVDAGRVIREAEGSLGHARKQDSKIVGFRPDPRKYRQFVSEQLGSDE